MFCFGAKETFLEPALFCLVVPSSSTSGFYLVAQDGCSSSRPWVSSSVIGLCNHVFPFSAKVQCGQSSVDSDPVLGSQLTEYVSCAVRSTVQAFEL